MISSIISERKPETVIKAMDIGFEDLEAIKEKSRIPIMMGAAGDVLAVLQERIGKASLNITDVADHMKISKRTLQRHLQHQDMNYAALRDRVRFNRAFYCLLHEGKNIEETSEQLDFSDRTSFTNAFKRWTNLSPSAFRKLYRDYV